MQLPNWKHFCGTIICELGSDPQNLIPQKFGMNKFLKINWFRVMSFLAKGRRQNVPLLGQEVLLRKFEPCAMAMGLETHKTAICPITAESYFD